MQREKMVEIFKFFRDDRSVEFILCSVSFWISNTSRFVRETTTAMHMFCRKYCLPCAHCTLHNHPPSIVNFIIYIHTHTYHTVWTQYTNIQSLSYIILRKYYDYRHFCWWCYCYQYYCYAIYCYCCSYEGGFCNFSVCLSLVQTCVCVVWNINCYCNYKPFN